MNRTYAQIIVALFGAAMVAWSVHKDWRINNRSNSDFAKQYADMVLDTLPEGAVLFVFGDFGTTSMGYYQHIENAVQMSRYTVFREFYLAIAFIHLLCPKKRRRRF